MYLEDIMLSEISQTEKDKYSVITYMWNLKKRTKTNVYNKTEKDIDIANKLVVTSEEKKVGGAREQHSVKRHKLLRIK